MLYRRIITLCYKIHTKHINTLCGQNVELFCVETCGTQTKHWDLKDYIKVESCTL